MALQTENAPAADGHSLLLKHQALGQHAGGIGAPADAAARVDDPMPRHILRAVAHRESDRARRARRAEHRRDLSIRRHSPARDVPHQPVHGAMK